MKFKLDKVGLLVMMLVMLAILMFARLLDYLESRGVQDAKTRVLEFLLTVIAIMVSYLYYRIKIAHREMLRQREIHIAAQFARFPDDSIPAPGALDVALKLIVECEGDWRSDDAIAAVVRFASRMRPRDLNAYFGGTLLSPDSRRVKIYSQGFYHVRAGDYLLWRDRGVLVFQSGWDSNKAQDLEKILAGWAIFFDPATFAFLGFGYLTYNKASKYQYTQSVAVVQGKMLGQVVAVNEMFIK